MGWLSAIGAGGGQAVDRYARWRQLDQENQWKEAERQRQLARDEQDRLDAELQRKATQLAVTKGELGNITDRLAPGAAVDDATIAELTRLGAGHLYDPTKRVYTGTFEQQQAAAKARRDEEIYGLEKNRLTAENTERERRATAQRQLDEWAKMNPKAGARQILEMSGRLGVSELPPALKAIVELEADRQRVAMQTQAQIEAARLKAKLDEDALTKQHALQLGQDYKTMPKSINELYAQRAAEYIKNTKEQPGPELQAQVIMEWSGLQNRLAQTQRDLKLPVTVNEAPGGSPFYQQQLQAIPGIAMQIASGSLKPDVAMAEIHKDGAEGRLTGPEMQALRNQLRSYLSPLGFDMPFFSGNEVQQPSPVAAAIRPTSTFAANIRSGVGNGR